MPAVFAALISNVIVLVQPALEALRSIRQSAKSAVLALNVRSVLSTKSASSCRCPTRGNRLVHGIDRRRLRRLSEHAF